jgi:hypothetical protein
MVAGEPCSRSALSFKNKGRIRVGADADITLFDPGRVIDRATFEEPLQYSEGIVFVLLNGVLVVKDGQLVEGVYPGREARAPISHKWDEGSLPIRLVSVADGHSWAEGAARVLALGHWMPRTLWRCNPPKEDPRRRCESGLRCRFRSVRAEDRAGTRWALVGSNQSIHSCARRVSFHLRTP